MSEGLPEALQVALQVIHALERASIPYHIGGSIASSLHGVPRQTNGVDLVVELDEAQAAQLVVSLHRTFYGDESTARESARLGRSFNLVHLDTGTKLDVFVRGSSPFDLEEFRRRQVVTLGPGDAFTVFVKSPEDTLLRKLLWYRAGGEVSERQWSDVLGIIRIQGDRLDRQYLAQWASRLGITDLLDRASQT